MTDKCFSYDQGAAIVSYVLERVREARSSSLLDIGAGSPRTALPIAAAVVRYLGIENDPVRARRLIDVDLEVRLGTFPIPIDEVFDFVLCSHSLPNGADGEWKQFIDAAWESVAGAGLLSVITFRGASGGIVGAFNNMAFPSQASRPYVRKNEAADLETYLQSKGQLIRTCFESHAHFPASEEAVNYFWPWLGSFGLSPERKRLHLHDAVKSFATSKDVIVPVEHAVLTCIKPAA